MEKNGEVKYEKTLLDLSENKGHSEALSAKERFFYK